MCSTIANDWGDTAQDLRLSMQHRYEAIAKVALLQWSLQKHFSCETL